MPSPGIPCIRVQRPYMAFAQEKIKDVIFTMPQRQVIPALALMPAPTNWQTSSGAPYDLR